MALRTAIRMITAVVVACAVSGCLGLRNNKPLKYLGDAELDHYLEQDTRIDYPQLEEEIVNGSVITEAPRRIRHPRKDELWNLHLVQAIHLALSNNKIIRDRAQFLSPQNSLLLSPNRQNNSVFDPAIQETNVSFGQRGLNAALADFDANFTTTMLWGRNETVQNNRFLSGGLSPGDTLTDETAVFTSRLEKQMADGGIFSVSHNWNYSLNNVPSRLFGSSYTGVLQFDYRRPMWAGSGTEFTRIVGPIGRNLQGIPTVFQGVVLSRINNDISLANFEANVRNMLKDVEDIYWDLVLTYQTYHSEVIARDSALGTWRKVQANFNAGRPGVGAADEAQARDNYFEAKARSETALADLFSMEGQLRRMLGLPVNDGKIIRPADEPATAEIMPNWRVALTEALTRRVELRQQKWNIKSLELQLKAAKSLTRPRLDFVSSYGVNGFGDRLISQNDADGVTRNGLRSAYGTLTQGDQTRWNLGFEFWVPLGFRRAHAQVRNFQHRLVKARVALAAQEHEISHELSQSFQNIDRWYQVAKTNFSRRQAADKRVRSFEALLERNPQVLDLLLRAQISLSQANIAYQRSIVEYNKAIVDLHYRKGTLLEMNKVSLSEGLWSAEAYKEALRRAWSRSNAVENQALRTEPEEFVADGVGSDYLFGSDDDKQKPVPGKKLPEGKLPPSPSEIPRKKPKAKKTKTLPNNPFTDKPIELTPEDQPKMTYPFTLFKDAEPFTPAPRTRLPQPSAVTVPHLPRPQPSGRPTLKRFPLRREQITPQRELIAPQGNGRTDSASVAGSPFETTNSHTGFRRVESSIPRQPTVRQSPEKKLFPRRFNSAP